MKNCIACNERIEDDAIFCGNCGEKQLEPEKIVDPQEAVPEEISVKQTLSEKTEHSTQASIVLSEMIEESIETESKKKTNYFEDNERPVKVTADNLNTVERSATQKERVEVTGNNASNFKEENLPIGIVNWIEGIEKSTLPFVYSGSKLNDKKCRKALKKIGVEGTVLGAIVGDGFVGPEGLAVTREGIWFYLEFNTTKKKGVFLFDSFTLHSVTVKKGDSSNFVVEFVIFDLQRAKSLTFKFSLFVDGLAFEESMNKELNELFNTLISKTATEYTEIIDGISSKVAKQNPNTFDFVMVSKLRKSIHITITLKEDSIVITKQKNDKTNIPTSMGTPVTILRSEIASVKKGRICSLLTIIKWSLAGIILAFIFDGIFLSDIFVYTIMVFLVIGFLAAFPKILIIEKKDGEKYKIRFHGSDINNRNYYRFINVFYPEEMATPIAV
jgi:hypothetical protein